MNQEPMNNIEVIYDPRSLTSSLPIRKAAAIAVSNNDQKVLIVRRSNIVEEFKGVWSFPSVFIEDDDDDILGTITKRLMDWLALEIIDVKLAGKRMGIRPKWRLLMHLFVARNLNEPVIQTEKYDAFNWVDGQVFFSQFRYNRLGECTKAYLDYLKEEPYSE